jgi:neural Wiskott-Aldrich syndrome protein
MIVDDLGRIPMSQHLAATLTRAASYADAQQHPEVTLEHLLLALTEDQDAVSVLRSSNVDLARLAGEVATYIGQIQDRREANGPPQVLISPDLKRILEAAAAAARQGRRAEINGAIVLAAIVGDGKSTAANLLRVQGLTFEQAIRALQRAAPAPTPQAPQPASVPGSTEDILASARERVQTRSGQTQPVPPPAPAAPSAAPPPQPSPSSFDNAARETTQRPDFQPLEPRLAEIVRQPAPPPPQWDVPPGAPAPQRQAPATQPPPRTGPPPAPQPPPVQASPYQVPPSQRTQPPPAPVPQGSMAPPPSAPRGPAPGSFQPPPQGGMPPMPAGGPPPSLGQPPTGGMMRQPPPQQRPPQGGPPGSMPPGAQRQRRPSRNVWVAAGQFVENIPRKMRVGVSMVVEARIGRRDVKAIAEGMDGGAAIVRHEITVTKAMSVRLRSPDGGFFIESASPETQWIEGAPGFDADYASWRWTITPRDRGKRRLQLLVSARTVGDDGLTAETALPDQVIDVKVTVNYAKTAARWAGWMTAAVAGGVLARFGEGLFEPLMAMMRGGGAG